MSSTSLLRIKFFMFAAVLCISSAAFAQRYSQTNLVSDISGLAAHTDSRLVNPWGNLLRSDQPVLDRRQWHRPQHAV